MQNEDLRSSPIYKTRNSCPGIVNFLNNIIYVRSDDALALMWAKHLVSMNVLMSVHISNKEIEKLNFVKDFRSTYTQTTRPSIVEQILLDHDAEASEQKDI